MKYCIQLSRTHPTKRFFRTVVSILTLFLWRKINSTERAWNSDYRCILPAASIAHRVYIGLYTSVEALLSEYSAQALDQKVVVRTFCKRLHSLNVAMRHNPRLLAQPIHCTKMNQNLRIQFILQEYLWRGFIHIAEWHNCQSKTPSKFCGCSNRTKQFSNKCSSLDMYF